MASAGAFTLLFKKSFLSFKDAQRSLRTIIHRSNILTFITDILLRAKSKREYICGSGFETHFIVHTVDKEF